MISLNKFFKKYTGVLRSIKPLYVINNFLNRRQLLHNKELYKKYGLQRSIYSSIGSHNFEQKSQDIPWLDQENAKEKLLQHPDFQKLDKETQKQLIQFEEKGYMILRGFFTKEEIATANAEIDKLLHEKKTDFNYTGKKIMEAYKDSQFLDQVFFRNPQLLHLMAFAMGKKILPFHTINFIEGSEQRAHSDSIHMTTEPQGYLIAAWIALEKTFDGNGPLFYYPGSHRLPYIMCPDYDSGNTDLLLGEYTHTQYEEKIAEIVQTNTFPKEYFYAEPGDVLIWHANLLHGGEGIKKAGATRKSMVAHYFCEGVICYHEMSQRPAMIPKA